jgi:hypothetical protein
VLIACMLETYIFPAVKVDVKMLDVNKEELWINGTYKFECIIVLIASMLDTYMLRAVKLDVKMLDVNKEEL